MPLDPPLVDVDAYFARIGYDGPRQPTLSTLEGVVLRHVRSIPFENLDPLLGRPVRLDPASIERKLIRERRGGYCYEHNLLAMHVLRGLGFEVGGLAARVLWGQPEDALTPRSHMLLRVELAGRSFVVDVGFGAMTPSAPLLLQVGVEQPTPHEPFRLVAEGDDYRLEGFAAGEWKRIYRFDLQPQAPIDYVASNWWLSTFPGSPFIDNLFLSRVDDGCRYVCVNGDFAIHRPNRPSERRAIRDVAELRSIVEHDFGIPLDGLDGFDEAAKSRLGKQVW